MNFCYFNIVSRWGEVEVDTYFLSENMRAGCLKSECRKSNVDEINLCLEQTKIHHAHTLQLSTEDKNDHLKIFFFTNRNDCEKFQIAIFMIPDSNKRQIL